MARINGEEVSAEGRTILEYLRDAGFAPEKVVVERNLEIIPREEYAAVRIEETDSVEILHFVGGG